jgi:hypothetical protein
VSWLADPTFTADALRGHALAMGVAAIAWAALLGLGRALSVASGGQGRLADAGVLGFLAAVALLLPLGATGALSAGTAAGVALLGLAAGSWSSWRQPVNNPTGGEGGAIAVAAAALLALPLIVALAPPIDTDELYWHLAAPHRLLREGELPGGWTDPVASRPLPLQLVYAALISAGGFGAAKVFHWMGAALLLAAVHDLASRHGPPRGPGHGPPRGPGLPARGGTWAVLLLAGSWTFLEDAGLAHDNLPVALLIAAALDAALRGDAVRMGLAAGAALSVKYTAAPSVVAAWLVLVWSSGGLEPDRGGGRPARVLLAPLVALIPLVPWWARNALDGLHPLFPYAGWPTHGGLVFAWPEKYGAGHDALSLLRLPVDLVLRAETDSFVFLGRLHPAWSLSLPVALWAAVRDVRVRVLLGATIVAVVGWWFGVQWMRHLLPVAPIAAVTFGLALQQAPTAVFRLALAVWLVLLPPQVLDHLARAGRAVPVVTGRTTTEQWYEAELPSWPAIAWVNEYTPRDAKIALLFVGDTALVERATILGSVEDHTPARWLVFAHGDEALVWLEAQGATYVVVQRVGFLRKSYPFLSEADFRTQFSEPEAKLRDLLLHRGRLVFEAKRHAVWALDAPAPGG